MCERERIIAVDFDGCLCENAWPEIGEAKQDVIDALLSRQKQGAKIILWTCRVGEQLDAAVRWCVRHGIVFDAINENLPVNIAAFGNDCRKVFADEYWDDKSVNAYSIEQRVDSLRRKVFPEGTFCNNAYGSLVQCGNLPDMVPFDTFGVNINFFQTMMIFIQDFLINTTMQKRLRMTLDYDPETLKSVATLFCLPEDVEALEDRRQSIQTILNAPAPWLHICPTEEAAEEEPPAATDGNEDNDPHVLLRDAKFLLEPDAKQKKLTIYPAIENEPISLTDKEAQALASMIREQIQSWSER